MNNNDNNDGEAAYALPSPSQLHQETTVSGQAISATLGGGNQFNYFVEASDNRAAPVSITPPLGQRDNRFPLRGREEMVNSLFQSIREGEAQPRVHVLNGLGGCGKTSIALEVAARALAIDVETWWISAATKDQFLESIYALCRRTGVSMEELAHGDAVDSLWHRLNGMRHRWLLVIDNADDPKMMEIGGRALQAGTGWLRPVLSSHGAVIVTSRDGQQDNWGPWCWHHKVNALSHAEAANVLHDYVGDRAGSRQEAVSLAERLGRLPLALRLAGSYLADAGTLPLEFADSETILSFSQYQQAVEKGQFNQIFPRIHDNDQLTEERARVLVTKTWELSLDLLHRRGMPRARCMLRLLSFLADSPIPYKLLLHPPTLAQSKFFTNFSGRECWDILQALEKLGLLSLEDGISAKDRTDATSVLRVHPLVRRTSRYQNDASDHSLTYIGLAAALLEHAIESLATDADEPDSWRQWSFFFPHISHLLKSTGCLELDAIREQGVAFDSVVALAIQSLEYLRARGLYEQAESECRAVFELLSRVSGAEDSSTLAARHRLGHILADRGRLEEAEIEHLAVLEAHRRVLGEEHPKTLTIRHCLAGVLKERGLYEQAESECRSTLEARIRVLGAEDSSTLATRHRLGHILADRGRLEEAEIEHRAVLEAERRLNGDSDSSTLETWNCLAGLLQKRGQLEAAEVEFRTVLGLWSRAVGDDHPETLTTRNNLAALLQKRGKLKTAETEYRAVLEAETRILGEEHPSTLTTRNNLAALFKELGKLEAAEVEYRAVVELRMRVLGAAHPSTISTRYDLAGVLRARGKLKAAEIECRAVLELSTRVLGDTHPRTLATRHGWGHILQSQGKLREAEIQHRAVLETQMRLLGPEHSSTLRTWNCLAGLLLNRGDLQAAEKEYHSILAAEIRILGEEHASTLATRHNLGHLMERQGKLEEAEIEHRRVLEVEVRALGEGHPETLSTQHCLAILLRRRGQFEAANVVCRAVLRLRTQTLGEEHPSTLATRYELVVLLEERGQLETAELECRAVLEARTRVLGEAHLSTLVAQDRLVRLLQKRGQMEAAEVECRAVLELRNRVLGNEHPRTLAARKRLDHILHDQ